MTMRPFAILLPVGCFDGADGGVPGGSRRAQTELGNRRLRCKRLGAPVQFHRAESGDDHRGFGDLPDDPGRGHKGYEAEFPDIASEDVPGRS